MYYDIELEEKFKFAHAEYVFNIVGWARVDETHTGAVEVIDHKIKSIAIEDPEGVKKTRILRGQEIDQLGGFLTIIIDDAFQSEAILQYEMERES